MYLRCCLLVFQFHKGTIKTYDNDVKQFATDYISIP